MKIKITTLLILGCDSDGGDDTTQIDDDETNVPDDNAGWTDPVSIGCCCVCHENGTTKYCPWCVDCPR